MGSLTSTPKVATATSKPASSTPVVTEEPEDDVDVREEAAEERKKSLPARPRAQAASAQLPTSLQGLLSSFNDNKSRKTLLGE